MTFHVTSEPPMNTIAFNWIIERGVRGGCDEDHSNNHLGKEGVVTLDGRGLACKMSTSRATSMAWCE